MIIPEELYNHQLYEMYQSTKMDDRYTKKDWYVCEQCHHTNVINILEEPRFKKKQRHMWVGDATWNTFKGLAGEYGMDHAAFLSFLIGILQREKITYDRAGRD